AGEPPHLTVTIDWDALRTALGTATLDYRQLINAGDARRLACDCKLIPVVLGSDSAGGTDRPHQTLHRRLWSGPAHFSPNQW
ncbi:MAG: hypothetical protein M3Y73_14295, partial [Actinomycetota bacterium]|nr:hypothetical protein [Actinomycetota bacterium]